MSKALVPMNTAQLHQVPPQARQLVKAAAGGMEDMPAANNTMDLVKSTLAPRIWKTQPPNYYTQTAFPKRLDVSANFIVDDSLLSTRTVDNSERVQTATGLIVWQPNRGAGSIYRFGIVPAGAYVRATGDGTSTTSRGFLLRYWPSAIGYTQLTFASATAVPYNNLNPNDIIKISPDLGGSFSQIRVYSGDLRVICDTVPIGATALNGYFSCGSFSDSRDVSQVTESGNLPSNVFDPSDLVQMSVTNKDGLKEVSVMKGIVSLVGSDIQPYYAPPNTDDTDVVNAGFSSWLITGWNLQPTTITPYQTWIMLGMWMSPWNTQLSVVGQTGQNAQQQPQNINTGPINLNGVLDFQAFTNLSTNIAAGIAGAPSTMYIASYSHVFATCTSSPTYACSYIVVSEEFQYIVFNQFTGIVEPSFTGNPRMFQTNLNTTAGGIYIGSSFLIQAGTYEGTTTISPTKGIGTFGTGTMKIRARSIYNQGELGPTRVIRWDGLSNQQQLKVDGVVNAQCIPEGSIAPFVQPAAMYSDTAHNLNAITLLAELYNGDSPLRRNWTGETYDEFMRTVFPHLTAEKINEWRQKKINGIMQACGVFDQPHSTGLPAPPPSMPTAHGEFSGHFSGSGGHHHHHRGGGGGGRRSNSGGRRPASPRRKHQRGGSSHGTGGHHGPRHYR